MAKQFSKINGCLHDFQSFDKQSKYIKYVHQKCLQMTRCLPYTKQNQEDTFEKFI